VRQSVLDAMLGNSPTADSASNSSSTTSSNSTNGSSPSSSTNSIDAASAFGDFDSGLTQVILPGNDGTVGVIGDPTSLEAPLPTPPPPKTSLIDSIMNKGAAITSAVMGVYAASMAAMAMSIFPLGGIVREVAWNFAHYLGPFMPLISIVAIVFSAYTLFKTFQSLFDNGFSWSGMGQLLLGIVSIAMGVGTLLGGPYLGLINPITWLVTGAIVLADLIAAALTEIFGTHDKKISALEQPLASYPPVWYNGPVLFITAGLALTSMGFNLTPSAPLSQVLTVPDVALRSALNGSGLVDANGTAVDNYSLYGSVFVQKGNGSPDQVMIVSPSDTTGEDTVNVYKLAPHMTFSSPSAPNGAYIPILIPDSKGKMIANPQAVQAMRAESGLSRAAAALGSPEAQAQSAAADKKVKASSGSGN
jgi:hypothetical protein